jgi:hypothetical protein
MHGECHGEYKVSGPDLVILSEVFVILSESEEPTAFALPVPRTAATQSVPPAMP